MKSEEQQDRNIIEQSFEMSQKFSRMNGKHNFKCPICKLTRIAKAQTGEKDEWLHTGCRCTYQWLSAHGKLFVALSEKFVTTGRFKG